MQHKVVGELLEMDWGTASNQVFSNPRGRSAVAARTWRRAVEKTRVELVRRGCPDPPTEMAEVIRLSRARTVWHLRDVQSLVDALDRWTLRIGQSRRIALLLRNEDWCLEHRDSAVDVSYTIREVPTALGKDMWIEVSVENLMSRPISGGRFGTARVVGARGRTALKWSDGKKRRDPVFGWGGGSGDDFSAKPHQRFVWQFRNVVGHRFHVTRDGSLTDVRVGVWGGPDPAPPAPLWKRPYSCSFPARPKR